MQKQDAVQEKEVEIKQDVEMEVVVEENQSSLVVENAAPIVEKEDRVQVLPENYQLLSTL